MPHKFWGFPVWLGESGTISHLLWMPASLLPSPFRWFFPQPWVALSQACHDQCSPKQSTGVLSMHLLLCGNLACDLQALWTARTLSSVFSPLGIPRVPPGLPGRSPKALSRGSREVSLICFLFLRCHWLSWPCAQCLKDFVLYISLGFSVISSGRVNPVLIASSCRWCSSVGLTLFELKKLKKKNCGWCV